ncbi:acyl-CoA thioesterase/bile acid-CoA:amino acid N-acyltransferase family protein [Alkalihalobacillus pseudalcaliphilus]|uniref:acyl-CoA thioesterase/bile acid-CoA:amino acid N-acyltransferase family protein n=1 Tax=Alkalihalobacillus pseudalcaliphilus TaxID=79884 RepID=UPI00064D8C62|nr:acyl-CoA thioester hydrolase/BAAT C-terminal domain-containing protein [Alkalihalobacillus pseudalcaliphilus]KMK76759.1 hypothetical protein AB990_07535 [Alkalihalobacillus pseudalcaliphilus]
MQIKDNSKIEIIVNERASILEPFNVQIKTRHPETKFEIALETKDDDNKEFKSKAVFKSDKTGLINLETNGPISGDYESIDNLGMIWSMSYAGKKNRMFNKQSSKPIKFELKLQDLDGHILASKSFERYFFSEKIIKKDFKHDFLGTGFYPENEKELPGVIILGGSDASVHESAAALLASKGYFVLALAYFGKEGLPKGIQNIPLEYVDNAFVFLENQPNVNKEKLAIIGHSRGAELALLYASKFPKLKAVIASAPSSIIFSGIDNFQPTSNPAWTYKGVPFPYYPIKSGFKDTFTIFKHLILRKPYSNIEGMKNNLNDNEKIKLYSIPVQEIKSPIMVLAGTDDHVQPVEIFIERMKLDLKNHEYRKTNKFIIHQGAGHFSAFPSNLPNLPQTTEEGNALLTFSFGGTKKVNASVAVQSWQEVITFLGDHLLKD